MQENIKKSALNNKLDIVGVVSKCIIALIFIKIRGIKLHKRVIKTNNPQINKPSLLLNNALKPPSTSKITNVINQLIIISSNLQTNNSIRNVKSII